MTFTQGATSKLGLRSDDRSPQTKDDSDRKDLPVFDPLLQGYSFLFFHCSWKDVKKTAWYLQLKYSLIEDNTYLYFIIFEVLIDCPFSDRTQLARLWHVLIYCFEWAYGWTWSWKKRRREWGMQLNCSPKALLFEPSGHRNGRRVWIGGSLRSEEKDQCESPRIQRNKKGACRTSAGFNPYANATSS